MASGSNIDNALYGITGIMVDIEGLPDPSGLSAEDFEFRVGHSKDPSEWEKAPAPAELDVRPGAGVAGSDRVTLTWPEEAIRNTWLEVRVRANERTGLAEDEVFYLGNQAGDASGDRRVNATDVSGAWSNFRGLANPAPIDFAYDINKDRRVNATDISAMWSNLAGLRDALPLIEPSASQEDVSDPAIAVAPVEAASKLSPEKQMESDVLVLAGRRMGWDWWRRENMRVNAQHRVTPQPTSPGSPQLMGSPNRGADQDQEFHAGHRLSLDALSEDESEKKENVSIDVLALASLPRH
jgi:hypothetical protein